MIRLATAGDLSAVRACAGAAFAPYVAVIGRPPAPMTADYAALIAAARVHVAEDEGGIAGFVVFHRAQDTMLLDTVAVRPDRAGRGLGKALIGFCEHAALRLGLRSVRLYTNAAMAANLTLYPHLGYAETDRRREDGFDRVFFEKRLG